MGLSETTCTREIGVRTGGSLRDHVYTGDWCEDRWVSQTETTCTREIGVRTGESLRQRPRVHGGLV